jgi:putative ABC transport system permease protein
MAQDWILSSSKPCMMLRSNFLTAFRSLVKNKVYTLIDVFGLALGMACTILIILYVRDELTYESQHQHAENIYRVITLGQVGDNEINTANSSLPLGNVLKQEFPFVKQFVRVKGGWSMSINYEKDAYNEDRFYFVDSSIFEVFTIPFLRGNPATALNRPNTVVITESIAKKYFGNDDPMGKRIKGENDMEFEVTGIVKDVPVNTHFKYDFLASYTTRGEHNSQNLFNVDCMTYILTEDGYDPADFPEQFKTIVEKYMAPQLERFMGQSYYEIMSGGNRWDHVLQPIRDIHLRSHLEDEHEANSDIKYVYIFSIIAIFILLIACINFMNISTARAATRAKEVGIRKVTGASKGQLVGQFLGESILLAFFAHILAMIIVETLLPAFNHFTGKEMSCGYMDFRFYLGILGMILFVGLIAGSYPAFILSSFKPITVLKAKMTSGNGRSNFRRILVIFQFSISIIIILGALMVNRQLHYLSKQDLGFSGDQVLVIERAYGIVPDHETFKQELLKYESIKSVTITSAVPGHVYSASGFYAAGSSVGESQLVAVGTADEDYLATFDMKIRNGRFFSKDFNDSKSVVLNQTAVAALGLTDPEGKSLYRTAFPDTLRIIGVVPDFNFESLHRKIRPLLLFQGDFNSIAIKMRTNDIAQTLRTVEKTWASLTDKSIQYYFMDEGFREMYKTEIRTGIVFGIFSGLAVIIALLGLIGLLSYSTEQRTKEVGIRKSLGATPGQIVRLFSKETLVLLLIANVISWPLAYFWMDRWLQDFAYRTSIGFGFFLVVLVLTMLISFLTMGYQTIRAASKNPVLSLKYE